MLVVLLSFASLGVLASDWEVIYLDGLAAFQRGQYEEAEKLWKEVIAEKRTHHNGERAASDVVHQLAELYVIVGKLDQAERTFKAGINGREQGPYPNATDLAQSNHSLGLLYYEQRRFAESQEYLERSLAHWRNGQQTGLTPYAAPT
ncbi:MAG: tetratricopeptide repeat protein, partial [Gammaproteobacteria bacterium]